LFDVGADPWPDDEFALTATVNACFAVDRFDCDCAALAVEDPVENPPPGEALAECRTS
jgi:hypothetical protein